MFYKKLGSTPKQQLTAGNLTQAQSKIVLRKLDSEMRHAEKLHHDTFQEITIIRLLLDGLVTKTSVVKGFIQFECHFPFILHLYHEEQLRIYLQHRQQEEWLVWHLDATGSIVRSNVGEARILTM